MRKTKMRIAMVVGAFPVVSESFILYQMAGLVDLGHDLRIVSLHRPPANAPVHGAVGEYSLLDRTTYADLPTSLPRLAQRGLCAFSWLVRRCGSKALGALRLAQRKWGLPHPVTLALTPWLCDAFHASDIVHCHFGPAGLQALPAARLVGKPQLTSFHGYDLGNYVRAAGPRVYDALFRHCDCFTANTQYTASKAIALRCPPSKVEILHEGLVVEDFPFAERALDGARPVEVLTIGRLVEKKGIEYAIRAVARLLSEGYAIDYTVLGEGPLRRELEALVEELGIQSHVNLAGEKARTAVIEYLQNADLFVLSSVTARGGDEEGQGLVLQEAQATGLPVISTLHNGIPEGVDDGTTGFLVPERDVGALADRLRYLIDHPHLWPEMGRAGRKLVEEQFDIRRLNQRLVDIYEDVIAGRGPSQVIGEPEDRS